MIDLKESILRACDAIDELLGEADMQSHERAAFVMGYLIGGPLESDREVFLRVYNQTPEDMAKQFAAVDDISKARLEKFLSPAGVKASDISKHLENDYHHPKLRLL